MLLPGLQLWNYTTGACVWSSPTVRNGRVYFGSEDRLIYCLTAFTPSTPILNLITPNPSSNGTIRISWNAVTGANTYKLYRSTSMITNIGGSVNLITTTGSTSFIDPIAFNGTYYYAVTAVNASGE